MLLTTILQLFAVCFGLISSVCFAIGVWTLKEADIDGLKANFYGFNPNIAKALVGQQVEFLFGGALLLISFVFQFASLCPGLDTIIVQVATPLIIWLGSLLLTGVLIAVTVSLLQKTKAEKYKRIDAALPKKSD